MTAIGGGKHRCRKGKSCSATCISSWKTCLVELPGAVSPTLDKLRSTVLGIVEGVRQKVALGKDFVVTPREVRDEPRAKRKEKTKEIQRNIKSYLDEVRNWKPDRETGLALKGKDIDKTAILDKTMGWLKSAGFSPNRFLPHDTAHVVIRDYLGINAERIAGLGGLKHKGNGPSTMEEVLVTYLQRTKTLSKVRELGEDAIRKDWRKLFNDKNGFRELSVNKPPEQFWPLINNSKVVRNALEEVIVTMHRDKNFPVLLETIDTTWGMGKDWLRSNTNHRTS